MALRCEEVYGGGIVTVMRQMFEMTDLEAAADLYKSELYDSVGVHKDG